MGGLFKKKDRQVQRTQQTTAESSTAYQNREPAYAQQTRSEQAPESTMFNATQERQVQPMNTVARSKPVESQGLGKKQRDKLNKEKRGRKTPEQRAEIHARHITQDERRQSGATAEFYRLSQEDQRRINRSMQPVTPGMGVNEAWIRGIGETQEEERAIAKEEGESLDDEWLDE